MTSSIPRPEGDYPVLLDHNKNHFVLAPNHLMFNEFWERCYFASGIKVNISRMKPRFIADPCVLYGQDPNPEEMVIWVLEGYSSSPALRDPSWSQVEKMFEACFKPDPAKKAREDYRLFIEARTKAFTTPQEIAEVIGNMYLRHARGEDIFKDE